MGHKSKNRSSSNHISSDSTVLNYPSSNIMEFNNLEANQDDTYGNNRNYKTDFETAIELTGYGKFHYILLIICGFVSTSEEMDVISMSFILPSAQCDLNLDTHSKGWLNSIIFIGMMVGAYFWGSISDAIGRRKVLIVTSFMNALCIVASSFCKSYEMFMLFRFFNGAALGGSGPVTWSYFAEFQPKKRRGSMLSTMAAFWTLGNLLVAGLAWIIIPSGISYSTETFSYNSWRIFLFLCSIPSFIVAILLFFLPESPKFLLSHGKNEKALQVFQKIHRINCHNKDKNNNQRYNVTELIYDEIYLTKMNNYLLNNNQKGKYLLMVQDIIGNSKKLFTQPILKNTVISIAINFTFHIGYYGLLMWFPELFNRLEEFNKAFPNQSASICEVTQYVTQFGSQRNSSCSTTIDSTIFLESLITVSAAIPSNLFAIIGMDKLGRKFFLMFSTFSSGISAFSMYFVYQKIHHIILLTIFSGVISCGNAALDCIMTEIFPTDLRATGVAISMIAARLGGIIGNIIIAMLLDIYCPMPIMIVGFLLIVGGYLSLLLPNTTKVPLP